VRSVVLIGRVYERLGGRVVTIPFDRPEPDERKGFEVCICVEASCLLPCACLPHCKGRREHSLFNLASQLPENDTQAHSTNTTQNKLDTFSNILHCNYHM
jgi:hypothetical protein